MAYSNLQEFYTVTAVIAAGGIEAYQAQEANAPSDVEVDTELRDYLQLVTAAKIVGPIALECLDAQLDADEPLTSVPQPDTQIVAPRVEAIMQIKRPSWFSRGKESPVKRDIIKSYSPIAEGWSVVDETYEFPDDTPDVDERIIVDTEGDLTLAQGTSLEHPEEGKLLIPKRIAEVPQTVSVEYDELLEAGRAVGRARKNNHDVFTAQALTDVEYIGNALMKFTVDTGLEYVLALKMLGDDQKSL